MTDSALWTCAQGGQGCDPPDKLLALAPVLGCFTHQGSVHFGAQVCRGDGEAYQPPGALLVPLQERYCPGLGEEERQQLEAFSTQRRQEALGQGSVCPVPPTSHECLCKKVRPLSQACSHLLCPQQLESISCCSNAPSPRPWVPRSSLNDYIHLPYSAARG